jgi:hypothetical protein
VPWRAGPPRWGKKHRLIVHSFCRHPRPVDLYSCVGNPLPRLIQSAHSPCLHCVGYQAEISPRYFVRAPRLSSLFVSFFVRDVFFLSFRGFPGDAVLTRSGARPLSPGRGGLGGSASSTSHIEQSFKCSMQGGKNRDGGQNRDGVGGTDDHDCPPSGGGPYRIQLVAGSSTKLASPWSSAVFSGPCGKLDQRRRDTLNFPKWHILYKLVCKSP